MSRVRRKICRTCKVAKTLRQFYAHPTYADGLMSDCKECKRAYQREMHWLKRPQILQRLRRYFQTERGRATRRAYAESPRGREILREARHFHRRLRRLEQAA